MIKTKNYKGALPPYQAPSKNTKTEAIEGGFFYLKRWLLIQFAF